MINPESTPPSFFLKLFRWFCHPRILGYIEGDLMEVYKRRVAELGKSKADVRFAIDVLLLFRPGIVRPVSRIQTTTAGALINSYLIIGFRNLTRNYSYSLINIGGLSIGLAVAMLIGLWINDELSFDRYHPSYDRIAQVMQTNDVNGNLVTGNAMPIPTAAELRTSYAADFKRVMLSSWTEPHVFASDDKKFRKYGSFMQETAPEILGLELIEGKRDALKDANSILISESLATAFFGIGSALDKTLVMDGDVPLKVAGVFRGLPKNSSFEMFDFVLSWQLNMNLRHWVRNSENKWDNNSFRVYVELADNVNMQEVSQKIQHLKDASHDSLVLRSNPKVFLQPMSNWHLYSEFKQGVNTGGTIQFVWMFGTIGVFVLILACINFMNLSTARSEHRAREVGIRKSLGSAQPQLVIQFLLESVVVALVAWVIAMALVIIGLPWFNQISGKDISLPWQQPLFWLTTVGFAVLTGLIAGSYPALYLSSFQPIKVLKGAIASYRSGIRPRQLLVVVQFTISISLIIGTVIVFLQVNYARERDRGYDSNKLVYVPTLTSAIHKQFAAVRNELISAGVIIDMAESESPLTAVWNNNGGFDWSGRDPEMLSDFAVIGVSTQFGNTIGWELVAGRDFIQDSYADSMNLIINESAVKYMGVKDPVGMTISEPDQNGGKLEYTVIGVIKDMVMASPYEPVKQTMIYVSRFPNNWVNMRLSPNMDTHEAVTKLGDVFEKYDPASLFTFRFADDEFALKFETETRVGKLATVFSTLAIIISCLGLFGLASFMAEQRTKEIGIRKIMGASINSLWRLLSKDFLLLVIVSCVIAAPLSWYLMNTWLESYEYRTEIPVWIFIVTIAGAIAITLLTISVQVAKAARTNPAHSLRTEV